MSSVVRIIGAPATGKSTLRAVLSEKLGIPGFGIDDERLRIMAPGEVWPSDDRIAWLRLQTAINANDPCIVETSGLTARETALYVGHETYTVLCIAGIEERRARLIARVRAGHPLARLHGYVRKTLLSPDPTTPVDVVWNGSVPAPVAPLAAVIGEWLAARTGAAISCST